MLDGGGELHMRATRVHVCLVLRHTPALIETAGQSIGSWEPVL